MSRNKIYNRLKGLSFNPQYIIDGGTCRGEWVNTIRSVFNNSTILAVDDSDWNKKYFPDSIYSEIEVLSDKDNDEIIFYKKVEGLCTGDSSFKEDTFHYGENNTIKEKRLTKTLKTLCEKKSDTKSRFIKD
jgi:hypothetical protein